MAIKDKSDSISMTKSFSERSLGRMRGITEPVGVYEFKFTCALPKNLKSSLPDINEIDDELSLLKESGDDNE